MRSILKKLVCIFSVFMLTCGAAGCTDTSKDNDPSAAAETEAAAESTYSETEAIDLPENVNYISARKIKAEDFKNITINDTKFTLPLKPADFTGRFSTEFTWVEGEGQADGSYIKYPVYKVFYDDVLIGELWFDNFESDEKYGENDHAGRCFFSGGDCRYEVNGCTSDMFSMSEIIRVLDDKYELETVETIPEDRPELYTMSFNDDVWIVDYFSNDFYFSFVGNSEFQGIEIQYPVP